jgi:hypothetical protein
MQKILASAIKLCILKNTYFNLEMGAPFGCWKHPKTTLTITTQEGAIMATTIVVVLIGYINNQTVQHLQNFLFFNVIFGSRYGP